MTLEILETFRVKMPCKSSPNMTALKVKVRCHCGNIFISRKYYIESGKTKSCGCYHTQIRRKLAIQRNKGLNHPSKKHGQAKTPIFRIWSLMKNRCNNPKSKDYKNYGGRGIKVCEEWERDFLSFKNHIGERPSNLHSIDRINNEGNYEPGNVKWSTRKEQNNNKRNNKKAKYE